MRKRHTKAAAPAPIDPVAAGEHPLAESSVARLWRVFRGEPMLLVTVGYLLVSVIGIWDSYWYYRSFGVPILEFMQSSDYFVAGLRRPAYALTIAAVLLISAISLLPERWRARHPARTVALQRRWWGRVILPRRSDWWFYLGLHPETSATLVGAFMAAILLLSHSEQRAREILRGGGDRVALQLADDPEPLPGDLRLLGTSSAFVFVYAPATREVQALPLEAVQRVLPLGRASPSTAAGDDEGDGDGGTTSDATVPAATSAPATRPARSPDASR